MLDVLAERAAVVARYQGGSNAGHTVFVGEEEFKFRLLPSGVLNEDALCVLGNGVVIEPEVLCGELDSLQSRGFSGAGLRISGNAHVVMPWHRLLDGGADLWWKRCNWPPVMRSWPVWPQLWSSWCWCGPGFSGEARPADSPR